MVKKRQQLFVGTFNYAHEVVIKYTWAPTLAAAKTRMLRRIANEHEVNYQHVFAMFDGSRDNCLIEVDREWQEQQGGAKS